MRGSARNIADGQTIPEACIKPAKNQVHGLARDPPGDQPAWGLPLGHGTRRRVLFPAGVATSPDAINNGARAANAIEPATPARGPWGVKDGLIGRAIGALIGMAIDGARGGETDVCVAASRVALTPAISRHAVGASVTMRW